MKPLSIRASLIAWFVGLTMLLLAAFAATLYLGISRALHSGLDARLVTEGSGLAALAEWDEDLQRVMLEMSEDLQAKLTANHPQRSHEVWVWPDRRPLVRSRETLDFPLPDASFGRDFDLSTAPGVEFSTVDGPRGPRRVASMLYYAPEIAADDEGVRREPFTLFVRIMEDLAPIEAQLGRLAWLVAGLGGIALLVVLAFGVFLSRRVVRPLQELGAAAREIRAGRAVELPRRGVGDEVDALGDHLEEAFSRLEAARQRQERFTSDAAHELRNPIAVIRSAAEVALRRERSPEDYRAFLGDILATSRRMGDAVEALLLLARMDAGTAGASFRNVDLVAIARDSAAAQPLADGRVRVLGDPAAIVHGDEGLLRVLVDNLLSNALRYSGPQAPVTVSVQNGDGTLLAVSDQGPGIPPESLGRVFDRFYRVETINGAPGAGLGLAIVAEVARLHAVAPHIDSSPRGTTVTVRFPPPPEA
ncbi:MAG: HAMP domain-containing protein [Planctomycetota bacterium]|nr:MAG: HAMP domain-containing protein [Planctomycetota bacterium]